MNMTLNGIDIMRFVRGVEIVDTPDVRRNREMRAILKGVRALVASAAKGVQVDVAYGKKTIVAVTVVLGGRTYHGVGVSRYKPGDKFDPELAIKIARGRAEVHIAHQLGGEYV